MGSLIWPECDGLDRSGENLVTAVSSATSGVLLSGRGGGDKSRLPVRFARLGEPHQASPHLNYRRITVIMTFSTGLRRSMVRPGSHGCSCLDATKASRVLTAARRRSHP